MNLQRQWALTILQRIVGLIAIITLVSRCVILAWDPTRCSACLFFAFSFSLLFRRRRYFRRSGASCWPWTMVQLFQFPGYLVLAGLTALGIAAVFWYRWGAGFALAELAVFSAVVFLGWIFGLFVDKKDWPRVAPAWALLFLLCVPSVSVSNWVSEPLMLSASGWLDNVGILHCIDDSRLSLIDQRKSFGIDDTPLLSGYLLFGLVCSVAAFRHWALVYGFTVLLLTVLTTLLLTPLTVLLGGVLGGWFVLEMDENGWHAVRLLAFLVCVAIIASASYLAKFLLSPVLEKRNAEYLLNRGRWSGLWNRAVSTDLGDLMCRSGVGQLNRSSGTSTWGFLGFLIDYTRTRRFRYLFVGMPSLVIVAGLVVLKKDRIREANDLRYITSYEQKLGVLIADQQFTSATLVVKRLLQLDPRDWKPCRTLLAAMIDSDQADSGRSLMRAMLAESDDAALTHLWLANQLLHRSDLSRDQMDEVEALFLAAIKSDSKSWQANYSYSLFLVSQGRIQEAKSLLSQIGPSDRAAELRVARLQQLIGDQRQAANRIDRWIDATPPWPSAELSAQEMLQLAEAYALRERWLEAAETLEAVMQDEANDTVRESLVRVLLKLCQVENQGDQALILQRLRRIAEINSGHSDFLLLCAKLLFSDQYGNQADINLFCRQQLQAAKQSGKLSPQVLVVLGTGAARNGDLATAEKHLRNAFELGDRTAPLLNNLAWVLHSTGSDDSQFTLELVSMALEKDARSVDSLATRAEIYVSLGRLVDAIADLERIVHLNGLTASLATQLANLYEQVGESETAEAYRRSSEN